MPQWMPGTSPGMTMECAFDRSAPFEGLNLNGPHELNDEAERLFPFIH
jgi:hypothetical protein